MSIMVEGFKFLRKIAATKAFAPIRPEESNATSGAHSDKEIRDLVRSQMNTLYHPCGTAAMMKKELGGVIDANMVVYGTSNLRVVDASVFPLPPAAHLQATVYAVAEKAADIIKKANGLD